MSDDKKIILFVLILFLVIGVISYFIAQELTNALRPESVGHYWKTLKDTSR